MSIASSDLVAYAAASMPTADGSTVGGAIDPLIRIDFTQVSSAERIKFISSSSSDTQNVTLVGRTAAGVVTSETFALTGTSQVLSTASFERILSVTLASAAIGTVTVSGNTSITTFRTIPVGEKGFRAIFQQLASDPVSTKTYYGKFFWKNAHGTLTLTQAQILENADPSAVITHALDTALDASTSSASRVTAPSGPTGYASTAANVPNSQNLTAGSAIGVWLKLDLTAGNAALKTTYTSEIDGQTT